MIFFKKVQERASKNLVSFSQTPIHSVARGILHSLRILPQEPGVCAQWISRGLVVAGVLDYPRMCPKQIAIDLMLRYHHMRSAGNFHIVSIRRAKHGAQHPTYVGWEVDGEGDNHALHGQSNFLAWLESARYKKLEKFADLILDVPNNNILVRITKQDPEEISTRGAYGLLLRAELESWVIPFLLIGIFWFSPVAFWSMCASLAGSVKFKSIGYIWECVFTAVSTVPFLLLGTILVAILGEYEGILDDAFLVALLVYLWRMLYKFVF